MSKQNVVPATKGAPTKASKAPRSANRDLQKVNVKPATTVVQNGDPEHHSKQGQLIDLLRRDEGAGISEIAAVLGWLPHTTRAALTRLRAKGYDVSREAGAHGQGSVYRLSRRPDGTKAYTDTMTPPAPADILKTAVRRFKATRSSSKAA